jgi:hypothetical protein
MEETLRANSEGEKTADSTLLAKGTVLFAFSYGIRKPLFRDSGCVHFVSNGI